MIEKTKHLMHMIHVTCSIGVIFALFTIVVSVYQYSQFNNLEKDAIEVQSKASELNEKLYHIQSIALLELMVVDEDAKASIQDDFDELDDEILSDINELGEILRDGQEQQILHYLHSNYVAFTNRLKLAADISSSQTVGSLQYYVSNVLNQYIDDMNENLGELQTITTQKANDRRRNYYSSFKYTFLVTFVFSVALVIILLNTTRTIRTSSKTIQEEFYAETNTHRKQIIGMQEKTINDLAELVESRDGSTGFHIKNTAWYVDIISRKLLESGYYPDILNEDYCDHLTQYAPLHDVGKILISDAILLKPGRLDADEFDKMKEHAAQGGEIVARILKNIETPENIKLASDIASYHHEKWDGSGYPFGLSGEQIPLCARIMAVADVFDALISPRCYKAAFPVEKAYEIIQEGSGAHFDPSVVDVFVELRPIVEAYLKITQE